MPNKKQSLPSRDWQDILKTSPTDIVAVEQKRRLPLKMRVIEIPDKVLNADVKRPAEELKICWQLRHRSRNLQLRPSFASAC